MQHPPTPPVEELDYGLHHLVDRDIDSQHAATWQLEPDRPSLPQYSSSDLIHQNMGGPDLGPFAIQSSRQGQHWSACHPLSDDLGLHQPAASALQPSYHSVEGIAYLPNPYTHGDTPMTPRSDASSGGRRTRSTRSVGRSNSPNVLKASRSASRVSKSRTRKQRRARGVSSKTPKLDAPLSEITRDSNIPVRDMEAWVNRSDEERQEEVRRHGDGQVKRPMNSFMLYRSAYAERTKQWCLQNNNQIVSAVSGESWKLEPQNIKQHYIDLAELERNNHAKAHPGYKFSPSKGPKPSRKRRDYSDEEEDGDMSDNGDPDWEWRPPGERRGAGRSRRQDSQVQDQRVYNNVVDFENGFARNSHGLPWELDQSGKPLPSALGHADMFSHFYQPIMDPAMTPNHSQQMRMVRQHSQQQQQQQGEYAYMQMGWQNAIPSGLPGSQHVALFHSNSHTPVPAEAQVDPMLLQFRGSQASEAKWTIDGGDSGHHFEDTDSVFGGGAPDEYVNDFATFEPTSRFEEEMDNWTRHQ